MDIIGLIGGILAGPKISPISEEEKTFTEKHGALLIVATVLIIAFVVIVKTKKK